jgi:septal ring-binding cell division protein DamX
MRFEIRTGGTILILAGLMGLSGAVFALGLVAGYEMARQNTPDISQVASVFPVPSRPAMQPSAAASPAPVAAPSPAVAPVAASTAGNLAKPVLSSKAAAPASTPKAVAARTTPAARPAPAEADEEDTGVSETDKPAPRSAAPAPESESRKKGYNIQIEAVMDHSGAEDMIRKLKALGYTPYEVATEVNGETWYRVRVGPYATPEAARAAQDKLKEQYKAAYMSR